MSSAEYWAVFARPKKVTHNALLAPKDIGSSIWANEMACQAYEADDYTRAERQRGKPPLDFDEQWFHECKVNKFPRNDKSLNYRHSPNDARTLRLEKWFSYYAMRTQLTEYQPLTFDI